MPPISGPCATRTPPISATCCCGRRGRCRSTRPTAHAGPAVSTRCWRTNTRTSIMPSMSGCCMLARRTRPRSSRSATMTRASTPGADRIWPTSGGSRRDFPGATQIKLEENFRSTGHILDAANAVIAQDRLRLGKTLFTCKPDGDRIEVVDFRNAEAEATASSARCSGDMPRASAGTRWRCSTAATPSRAASRRR